MPTTDRVMYEVHYLSDDEYDGCCGHQHETEKLAQACAKERKAQGERRMPTIVACAEVHAGFVAQNEAEWHNYHESAAAEAGF